MSSRPLTSVSPNVLGHRSKWTVSPEFGDALMTAMRERELTRSSQTGAPLPRLPSMLQLPSPNLPELPLIHTNTIKLDSPERLKMKTRVAIRDGHPHRFQVVPLRDARSYLSDDQHLMKSRSPSSGTIRSSRGAKPNTCTWRKPHSNENTTPSTQDQSKLNIQERSILSERKNSNVLDSKFSSCDAHVIGTGKLSGRVAPRIVPQPTSHKIAKVLKSSDTFDKPFVGRDLHFKSPSLGDIPAEPNKDLNMEAAPLPLVTCRKRSNTLSADYHSCPKRVSASLLDTHVRSDRHNTSEVDSSKRHAIYTQSLYVTLNERPGMPSKDVSIQPEGDVSTLRAFPFRSSIQTSRNRTDLGLYNASHNNALGFIDASLGSQVHANVFNSQSSITSLYSQDEGPAPSKPLRTRPLTCMANINPIAKVERVGECIQHHPIVLSLFADVEKAMEEWRVT